MFSPKSILTHIWSLTSDHFGPWERAVLGTVLVKTRKWPHWRLAKGKVTDSACTHIKHMYLRPQTWLDCPEGHTSKLRAVEKRREEKRSLNVKQKRVEKDTTANIACLHQSCKIKPKVTIYTHCSTAHFLQICAQPINISFEISLIPVKFPKYSKL